ncbi:hypothetical protein LXA43DRAFT_1185308 [Ganoderma leucocontextum]|nr:hypothetical protein LXA43DRAFT_1185308 [Ganoderma leucocontextum]
MSSVSPPRYSLPFERPEADTGSANYPARTILEAVPARSSIGVPPGRPTKERFSGAWRNDLGCRLSGDSLTPGEAQMPSAQANGKPFIRNYEGVNILEDALSRLAQFKVVLIREEYHRIWEHIGSLRNDAVAAGRMFRDGLVVTGHRGIGKSLFLFYALGAAFEARIPVVLCRNKGFCHIFDETGVKEFVFSRNDDVDVPCHALYLVDCDFDLHSPPSHLLGMSGVLVHTVPPGQRTYWKWAEHSKNASFWVMGLWTRPEMQALYPSWTVQTPPGTVRYTPLEVFDLLGPCARACFRMARDVKTQGGPKADFSDYICNLNFFFDSKLHTILTRVRYDSLPPTSTKAWNSTASSSSPTPARKPNPFALPQLRAVTMLVSVPSIAAVFYQPLIIDFLRETRTGPGLALPDGSVEFDPEAPPIDVEDDRILVPPPGFTAFDVLVISEDRTRVTMLRMADNVAETETENQDEDVDEYVDVDEDDDEVHAEDEAQIENQDEDGGEVKVKGDDKKKDEDHPDAAAIRSVIEAFDELLPRPEAVKWSFVYVALKGDRAKDIAERHKTRERLGGLYPRVQLGWMKLGSRDQRTRRVLNAFEKAFVAEKERQATQMTMTFAY